jgi:hypothetical protein
MIENILKEQIKKAIQTNSSFTKYLKSNYKSLNVEDVIVNELENFVSSREDVYQFSNFRDLFYEDILNFDPHRFANFLRNVMTDNPKREKKPHEKAIMISYFAARFANIIMDLT